MHGPYSLSVVFVHKHSTVYLWVFFFFFTYYKSLGYHYISIEFQEIKYLQNVTPIDNKTLL